jgi:hypothetical protein
VKLGHELLKKRDSTSPLEAMKKVPLFYQRLREVASHGIKMIAHNRDRFIPRSCVYEALHTELSRRIMSRSSHRADSLS